jgi:cytochrome c553
MAGRQGAGRRSAEGRLSAEYQEVNVSRVRRFSSWVFGLLVAGPLLAAAALPAAFGQNLDAGKSASQIFAEVCANCHRSPREFRSNPGASFLREHYTTGSEMASTMAAYLSAGVDPRGAGAPQPKRPPQATPPAGTAATRDAPPVDPSSRDPRRAQQPLDPRDAKESRDTKDAKDPKASPQPAQTRVRPGSARAEASKPDTTAETKPVQPPAPTRPALEEFEE